MAIKKKILVAASIGGHWIQLLRISKPLEEHYEVVYCSTHEKCATMVAGNKFHCLMDFSRWDAWKMVPAVFKSFYIVILERPKAVITTGAAPGLLLLCAAKFCGVKTIWIDSVANAEHPSACGRIASRFASQCYTQWPYESNDRFKFVGNVFG